MLKFRIALSALFAGMLLLAMPVLDIVVGAGSPNLVHVIVGGFGLALLAVSAAADAGRGDHA